MKDKYIPAPSPQEEAVAKGNYDEYRRQQEAEPKTMGEVIKSADPDSVLGKIRDIQNDIHHSKWEVSGDADSITIINEDTGEWNC